MLGAAPTTPAVPFGRRQQVGGCTMAIAVLHASMRREVAARSGVECTHCYREVNDSISGLQHRTMLLEEIVRVPTAPQMDDIQPIR